MKRPMDYWLCTMYTVFRMLIYLLISSSSVNWSVYEQGLLGIHVLVVCISCVLSDLKLEMVSHL